MDELEYYNRHYIQTRGDGCIIDGWSDGPHRYDRQLTQRDILINDKAGYQLQINGVENPPLFTEDSIPLYRWDGQRIIERAVEEIQAERDALPEPEPSAEEDRDAMLVDQELRLTMLELGLN